MYIEHEPNMWALRRDWLGARIVGGLGLGALLVAAVMWVVAGPAAPPAPAPTPAAPPPAIAAAPGDTIVVPTMSVADERRQENIAVCNAALSTAQQQALLPTFATLASGEIQRTNVQGRYICLVKTDAARYSIDFDLTCTNLAQGCILLYTVSQAGGGVLYQRK